MGAMSNEEEEEDILTPPRFKRTEEDGTTWGEGMEEEGRERERPFDHVGKKACQAR